MPQHPVRKAGQTGTVHQQDQEGVVGVPPSDYELKKAGPLGEAKGSAAKAVDAAVVAFGIGIVAGLNS